MGEVVSPNCRYTCREFEHEVNWKVVSPDSRLGTVGIYIQYITKIVVLVSEPVRGRSRATELPCYSYNNFGCLNAMLNTITPIEILSFIVHKLTRAI